MGEFPGPFANHERSLLHEFFLAHRPCRPGPCDDIHLRHTTGERQRSFQRIRQTAADALAQGKTVHHNLHRMLDVLFQTDLLVQIIQVAVDFYAGVTGAASSVQLFLLGAFALAHHGAST